MEVSHCTVPIWATAFIRPQPSSCHCRFLRISLEKSLGKETKCHPPGALCLQSWVVNWYLILPFNLVRVLNPFVQNYSNLKSSIWNSSFFQNILITNDSGPLVITSYTYSSPGLLSSSFNGSLLSLNTSTKLQSSVHSMFSSEKVRPPFIRSKNISPEMVTWVVSGMDLPGNSFR